ncbi:tetratricopeptide repeat protein [bacterium]|nr:tetratricopeptide repeat protein [bacterium]
MRNRRFAPPSSGAALLLGLLLLLAGAAAAQPADAPAEDVVLGPDEILASDLPVDEKIAAVNRLLAMNSRNADLYNTLGVLFAEKEAWSEARDAFLNAVQLAPRKAGNHKNLGLALSNLGQTQMAVMEFQAYGRLDEAGGRDAGLLIGDAWRRAGDDAQALASYMQALDAAGGYDEITALTAAQAARLLDAQDRSAELEQLLDRYADGAARQVAAVGGEPVDAFSRASAYLVDRRLALWTENARLLSEAGRPAEAAAVYERALEAAPHHDELLTLLATAWLDAGQPMKAKVLAQRAVTEAPERPGGWITKARIAEAERRTRDALDAYEKAYELDPGQEGLAAKIGQLHMVLGDTAAARRFMGAVASDPNTPPELLYNYAISLQREDEWSLSVAPLRRVVQASPDLAPAWRALGTALRRTDRYAEAARAFDRSVALEADPKAAFQAGYCHARADDHEAAVASYRRSLEGDPTNTKAWYNMILAEMKIRSHAAALADLDVLQGLEGDTYRVHFNRGIALGALGRNEEAVEAYELAIEQEETSAAWNNLGVALNALGEKSEAAECFKVSKELAAKGK